MKTCISTYSYWRHITEKRMTYFDAIDETKKAGADGVEICVFDWAVPEGVDYGDYVTQLTTHAREIGLEVPMLTCAANLYCDEAEEVLKRLKSLVDVAAKNNIPMMRHDITYKYMENDTLKTPQKVIKYVAPYVRELSLYAKEKGVKTCSENHGRIINGGHIMEMLLNEVDCDNYGLLCDISNFTSVDDDPVTAVGMLAQHICFVHGKDAFFHDGMRYDPGEGFSRTRAGRFKRATIFGHGDVPTYQLLAVMKNAGYDGYISMEFEGIEENIMANRISIENLKRMIADLEK